MTKRGILLTRDVLEAINKAREFFEIEGFPGNFFSHLENVDYVNKYKLLLFKEDLDKLSGFIGYGKGDMSVICINYKRSLGHQNFTLAHEIGHWLLHKGISLSDDDGRLYSSDDIEKEASDFAKELLYPGDLLVKDYYHAIEHDLFLMDNRAELGRFVNELCCKYCLSFDLVLRNLLYKHRQGKKYEEIRKQIEKALGGKVSEVFDKDFYVPNIELPEYQQLKTPYEQLEQKVNYLIEKKKIGEATGEAIKFRNRMGNE